MKIEIKKDKVRIKKEFYTNIHEEKDILYKICNDYSSYETQDILTYIYSLPKIDGVLGITDLLCEDGVIYGYTMPKLNGSVTLKSIIEKQFSDETKCFLIKKLTNTLKELHKYLVIGDIRLDNILIYENKPLFIDLENGQKIYERNYLVTLYDLRDKEYSVMDDIFKLFVCIMSILFNEDFEYLFTTSYDDRQHFEDFINKINSSEIKVYYEYLKESLKEDHTYPIYFTDIFDEFTPDKVSQITKKQMMLEM